MAQRRKKGYKADDEDRGRDADIAPVPYPEDERIILKNVAPGGELDIKTAEWLCAGLVEPKKQKFIMYLAILGNRSRASKASGIAYSTQWMWRQEDPAFVAAFVRAMSIASELHEDELFRRASEGTLEPVFQGGALVGSVRKFDTTALIFALKGAMPDKYADRSKNQVDLTFDPVEVLREARQRARDLNDSKEDNDQ